MPAQMKGKKGFLKTGKHSAGNCGLESPSRSKRRKSILAIENLFLAFCLCAGSFIAIISPPGTGMDEATHVARASQVAQCVFLPQEVSIDEIDKSYIGVSEEYSSEKVYGGAEDKALFSLMRTGSKIVSESVQDVSAIQLSFPYWSDAAFANLGTLGEGEVVWAFPNTSVNSPFCYIPYSIAYLLASLFSTGPVFAFVLMRLFGVFTFGFLVRFAIKNAPFAKNVMAFLALSPNCIGVCSMVSADTMTIAVSFVFFGFSLRFLFYYKELKGKDFVAFGVSLCLLALLKMPYIVFGVILFLIFVVNRLWESKKDMVKLALMGCLALFLFFAWSSAIKGINTYVIWAISGVDSQAQLVYALENPLLAAKAVVDNILSPDFGLFDVSLYCVIDFPDWLIFIAAACVVAIDARDLPRCQMKHPVAVCLLLLAAFVVVVINFALYLTYTPVGNAQILGVQPRYYVPVLIPIFVSLVLLCSKKGTNADTSELAVDDSGTYSPNSMYRRWSLGALATEDAGVVSPPVFVLFALMFMFTLRLSSVWLPF